ncbi:MAG: DEAD/DEAH box helicase [Rhodospirillaceae bacterium]|nr:DEAD/DEAH box helicase [Rhodospirillaceae bacterium]
MPEYQRFANAATPSRESGGVLLRPYQLDMAARIWKYVAAGQRRVLAVLATGGGKTVLAGKIISDHVDKGGRVLFVAHRRELISQASAKLHVAGVDHGIIQAGFPTRPGEHVQVASVQTLHARAVRTSGMEMPQADLVVVDEAHHVRARTYRQILAAYPDAIVVGLTATPCRADGRGLGTCFNVIVEGPSIAELIAIGSLVPTKVYAPATPDLAGVATRGGDYVEGQLAERMDKPALVGDVVTHWHRLADRRSTVVFATGVGHSLHVRDEFRRSGVMAEHIDGSTPTEERDAILARLAVGTVEVVCNCAVLTEGWDRPEVSCLVLARPTKSPALYRQMTGRVLRPAPGKVDALVLDHAGAVFEHGFVEDPVVWSLDEDQRAESRAQKDRRTRQQTRTLTTCPECSAVRWQGDPCGSCNWRPRVKPLAVEIVDGDLAAVDRDRKARSGAFTEGERAKFHGMLLGIARQRGYQDGWAAHKYREKFGTWPASRWITPQQPDDATLSWVRSRMIAYARGRAKAGAAA